MEPLKAEANALYVAQKYPEAATKFGEAITVFEKEVSDEPDAPADREKLAILYSNRAQCKLQMAKAPELTDSAADKSTARKLYMRASADSSQAVELCPTYAKGHYRKGMAVLGISQSMPQRAQEALDAFEACLRLPNVPPDMLKDVQQWRDYAEKLVNNSWTERVQAQEEKLREVQQTRATASPAMAPKAEPKTEPPKAEPKTAEPKAEAPKFAPASRPAAKAGAVVVASKSPAKVGAAEAVFAAYGLGVVGVAAESGVAAQPQGLEETRKGAHARLGAALTTPEGAGADFVVAIEGGVEPDPLHPAELQCFAVIVVQSRWGTYRSEVRSASHSLPPQVVAVMREEGLEQADAQDRVFGRAGAGKGTGGTVGMLTEGRTSRAKYYEHPLELALIPFLNHHLYSLPRTSLPALNEHAPVAAAQAAPKAAEAAAAQEVQSAPPAAQAAPAQKAAPKDAAAEDTGTWQELKVAATQLFTSGEFAAAASKYGAAIKGLEKEVGDEPEDPAAARDLSVLCTNQAHCLISEAKKQTPDLNPDSVPKPARQLAMRANALAAQAVELCPAYGKAHLRRGQALLAMPGLQQRAKEAVKCIEQAQACGDLAGKAKDEAATWLQYAKSRFDKETPMPDVDPSQCKQQ